MSSTLRSAALLVIPLVLAAVFPGKAGAYPFMVRHGYTSCGECHVDPSGAGALTEYGRGQAEILLRSPALEKRDPEWQPGRGKDFLFGAAKLPPPLILQSDVRGMFIPQPGDFRFILMQADLRGAVVAGRFKGYASLGYASEGAFGARVTSFDTGGNLVSREHWLGVEVAPGLLVRAGRMPVPFGLRTEEHILFVRGATKTDLNDDQQHGVGAVLNRKGFRAEAMALLGNYQLSPDDYRERGYSAQAMFAATEKAEIGVSSLLTSAALDIDGNPDPRLRQAHGVSARYSPVRPLVLFAEADALLNTVGADPMDFGMVGLLQADVEPIQGLHFKGAGEFCDTALSDADAGVGRGTFATQWFFAPHLDLRLDAMWGTLACTPGTEGRFLGLAQVHAFL